MGIGWKNYKKGGEQKPMTLTVMEFLRRFCLHFLPDRFQRIRHYGILSSRGRSCYIPDLQKKNEYQKSYFEQKRLKGTGTSSDENQRQLSLLRNRQNATKTSFW
jgi:hypothetical protein